MKKIAIYSFLSALFLSSFSGPVLCKEGTSAIDSLTYPLSDTKALQSGHFGLTVTSDGKLIPKPGPVFTEGSEDGMELPYLVSTPKPVSYPHWAIRQGWQGRVILAVEILPDGKVGRTQLMKSTGYRILDKAATEAIRSWKFYPAIQNGEPALSCIQIPIDFELKEE